MTHPKLARPYAKAAFEYAVEHQQLDKWSALLHTMAQIIKEPVVQEWLKNPKYGSEKHAQMCIALGQDVLDAAGQNFIKVLAKNRRLTLLPSISEQFAQLRAAIEQTLNVFVKSAIPLSADYRQRLIQLLTTKFNRRIILECQTAPDLLGGLLIFAGDCVMDGTVKGQLQRLRDAVIN